MSLLQVNPELAAASLAATPSTLDIIDTMPGCPETSVPRPHHMLHECPHDYTILFELFGKKAVRALSRDLSDTSTPRTRPRSNPTSTLETDPAFPSTP